MSLVRRTQGWSARGGRSGLAAAVVAGSLAMPVTAAAARVLPAHFTDQLVMGNLIDPVGLAFLPDGRLLVAERTGRVRFVVEGKLGAVDPLIEPESVYAAHPDAGLLGVAVDPGWPERPYVYLRYHGQDGMLHVARYRAAGDLSDGTSVVLSVDPASRYEVLRVPDRSPLRNGGTIRFGVDGKLYAALGDDADSCAAQDTTALAGSMLRLDVEALPDEPGGPPDPALLAPADNPFADHPDPLARLVWALGLRDPFRFHVDPVNGTLVVADRGAGQYEEIDLVTVPAANLGWPYFEGPAASGGCAGPAPGSPLAPIHAYAEVDGGGESAVVGAGVYRLPACAGCGFPADYDGDVFFADLHIGFLRRLERINGAWSIAAPVPGQPSPSDWAQGFQGVTDYVVGPEGALWFCHPGTGSFDGEVRRVLYAPPSADVPRPGPAEVEFAPPRPSPASGPVRFRYRLGREARVALELFDASGRRMRRLLGPVRRPAGTHECAWDGRGEDGAALGPGIYLARLSADGATFLRRVPIVR